MRSEGRFLLTFIFGRIFMVGNCRRALWGEDFKAAVWEATCSLECADELCLKNCTETPEEINELDEHAEAGARLVCRDTNFLVLAFPNPGVFVIEGRFQHPGWGPASAWLYMTVINSEEKVRLDHLFASTRYQFRFHRITAKGVSKPELTNSWMETLPAKTELIIHEHKTEREYEPMRVRKITTESPILNVTPKGSLMWAIEISFTPSEHRICFYNVTCRQEDGNYAAEISLVEAERFSVSFENLPFKAHFEVGVIALTEGLRYGTSISLQRAVATFVTPQLTSVEHLTKKIHAPDRVTGLNATAIPIEGNTYDVHVTWDLVEDRMVDYIISIDLFSAGTENRISELVEGSDAEAKFVFANVTIVVEYFDIYIKATNPYFGEGPEISRRFKTPHILIRRTDIVVPICLAVTILVIIGISVAVYWYCRLQKQGIIQVGEHEMSPKRLTIRRVLGNGAFGIVKLGSLSDDQGRVTNVAVKMLRDNSNENDLQNFLLEIKMMKELDKHPNIVSFLGCRTIGPSPLLVLEYCSLGDLHSFLRKSLKEATASVDEMTNKTVPNRRFSTRKGIIRRNSQGSVTSGGSDDYMRNFDFVVDQDNIPNAGSVTVMDMLNFGRQVATGMDFLSLNKVVHRDLAARNILVCDDRTVKIADFGLSRDVYQENVYKKCGIGRMPLKWMAIEALTHQVYSTCSDVWSFGILLWEIVTLGCDPYPGISTLEILKRLQSGYRMEKPKNCSVPLYNVMLSCWQTRPKDRPYFTTLREELDKLIYMTAENKYYDFNDVSEETQHDDPEVSSARL